MAIGKNRDGLELNKFRESTSVSGQPGIVVINPDGSSIGTSGGNATVAIGSAATLYVVTGQQSSSLVTLLSSPNYIGLATVDIGNPGTNAGSLGKAEDAAHASGDTGVLALSVFKSLPTQLAGTDSDYAVLQTDANGALYVNNAYRLDSTNDSVTAYLGSATGYIGLATVILSNNPALGTGNLSSLFVSTATGSMINTSLMGRGGTVATVDSSGNLSVINATGANYIGLATVVLSNQPALVASSAFIGLTTTVIGSAPTLYAVVNTSAAGQASVVLDTGVKFIGLTTTVIGSAPTLYAVVNTGAVGVQNSMVTLLSGPNQIGSVTVSNPVQLATGANYIGLATVTVGNTVNSLLQTGTSFIGLATTVIGNSMVTVTLGTALSQNTDAVDARNGGTMKTLIPLAITLSTNSQATLAVPTGGNAKFYITQFLLNSNATVRMNVKSGATYLTGNATLGINLNPGGGWVENGSPDSPVYIGLASGAAIVIEKADSSGNIAQIGGKIIYYQE